jgi:hypothetical protein
MIKDFIFGDKAALSIEAVYRRLGIKTGRPNDTGFAVDARGLPVFPIAEPVAPYEPKGGLIWTSVSTGFQPPCQNLFTRN